MAPPTYGDSDRHGDYHHYLVEHNFKDNPRLEANVNRLSSWLEFLLHPETHEYDREVYAPRGKGGGGQPLDYEWREESGPMYSGSGEVGRPPTEQYDFRSVLHEYRYSDFLDPLVAVSTQQVESGANLLAVATAAVRNIYWVGQKFTHELAKFPPEWHGQASVEASRFVSRLESVAEQLNLVVGELKDLLPKYGLVIKAARIDLDRAAGGLVDKFEDKFHTKSADGFTLDVAGLVISVIAAAAVTYMTGGTGAVIGTAMVTEAWSGTFKQAAEKLFGTDKETTVGTVQGFLWKELAESYLKVKDGILRDATAAVNSLNSEMAQLAKDFKTAVPKFEDTLPQLDEAPGQDG
ncbi:hypothetical protein [Actinophytocola sp.]|uniref:hypothetical protein n=1 Tax=Actinophytocola sp. TaxID=1872138 RepID=UPI002ED8B668